MGAASASSALRAARVLRVIVNPQAQRAQHLPRLDFGPGVRAIVEVADRRNDAVAIAQDARARGHVVVVAGGDGSVHTVVNALGEDGDDGDDADGVTDVGVIPLGTANDLAHELGIPSQLHEAAWRCGQGTSRRQDALVVNGRRAVVGGGFGLPALCIETVQALRAGSALGAALLRRGGGRVYQAAAPLHVTPRPPHIGVDVKWTTPEGVERRWQTHVIAGFFLNQRTVGRGLLLAPDAVRDDGHFELSFIMPSSSPKLLHGLWRVSVGKDAPGQVVVIPAVQARITMNDAMMIFADGEDLGVTNAVDVGVVRGGVAFVC